jgi:hypothetical protein
MPDSFNFLQNINKFARRITGPPAKDPSLNIHTPLSPPNGIFLHPPAGSRMLDLACGRGRHARIPLIALIMPCNIKMIISIFIYTT